MPLDNWALFTSVLRHANPTRNTELESNHTSSHQFWLAAWYEGRWWLWLLWPVSLLFLGVARVRRLLLQSRARPVAAPVVVVGNITLGGTGKTPLIIALVRYLQERGWHPGVMSRGYGGEAPVYPCPVTAATSPECSGDEPLLIARETGCAVVVDRDRRAAAQWLLAERGCDVLLSDDGLQHYRLARDVELVVVDGKRGLGNGLCLPAGPLREPLGRLREVDAVVINGTAVEPVAKQGRLARHCFSAPLRPVYWCNLRSGERIGVDSRPWPFEKEGQPIAALSGIGNPQRFFRTLGDLGLDIRENTFPDHHAFSAEELQIYIDRALLMTAKDAVKCQAFAGAHWWYLAVEMQLPEGLKELLDQSLESRVSRQAVN